MIKVCMLTLQHTPKDDRIFYKEAISLTKANYHVTIICLADDKGYVKDMGGNILNPNGESEFTLDGINIIGIKTSNNLIQKLLNKINLSSHYKAFIKKAIAVNATVYHAHEPQSAYIACEIQKKTKAKVIFDAHEAWIKKPRKDWWIKKLIINKLKYVITANQITRGDVLFMNPQLKTQVVYNCSNPDIFPANFYEKKLDNIIIAHEGSLWFDRGLKEIIEVIRLLTKDFPSIKFRIIGKTYGKEKDYLYHQIKKHKLESNIEETGWLEYEKVSEQLKDCSIGLITNTDIEMNTLAGPANKYFNYLSCGMAMVAVDLPETTRLLNKTKSGITIQERSVENIYTAIKRLLEDKELLKTYCKNSIDAYKQMNWLNEEKKLLSFYKDVVLNDTGILYR